MDIPTAIQTARTALGLELGSTRIKAVLIGPGCQPIASGAYDWENRLENGLWTYRLEDVWTGVQAAYRALKEDAAQKYGVTLTRPGALGVSAMMHGYLPFGKEGRQLASFRTWRNTVTEEEAALLTERFQFNIPQRWSIAHLYRAIRLGEPHVKDLDYLTTLAGYVHWMLTGQKVMGVGEAAGMFPIDSASGGFHPKMLAQFDEILKENGLGYTLEDVLPTVLPAGAPAGELTPQGAKLLDPAGDLEPGVPFCPPEGDAGTGMTATNSVAPRTGNVSAGTSIFAMVVLERPLSRVYPELDLVATPSGRPVAMVHCNTCTSDWDAWVKLFGQLLEKAGSPLAKPALYDLLYQEALAGPPDCGGVVSYNCYSGEPVVDLPAGRPLFFRQPELPFGLGAFLRAQLYAAMAPLKTGMDLLLDREKAALDVLCGHGGLFKTPMVGQRLMAGALGVPVSVAETAGEGGPWGMALLAMFRKEKAPGEALEDWLNVQVFANAKTAVVQPQPEDREGFAQFHRRYLAGLPVERAAGQLVLEGE